MNEDIEKLTILLLAVLAVLLGLVVISRHTDDEVRKNFFHKQETLNKTN